MDLLEKGDSTGPITTQHNTHIAAPLGSQESKHSITTSHLTLDWAEHWAWMTAEHMEAIEERKKEERKTERKKHHITPPHHTSSEAFIIHRIIRIVLSHRVGLHVCILIFVYVSLIFVSSIGLPMHFIGTTFHHHHHQYHLKLAQQHLHLFRGLGCDVNRKERRKERRRKQWKEGKQNGHAGSG
eukprot:TRINITY_DN3080_c0_g1_i1.p1 TRINITY_DN3080_c0_g1~~TRINITY_DN3080_c0_g1_i1.p1  ORF type:complete len:184 (-),score=43.95 TRINITY_DN3080_c0_g1_i1:1042-1593(-)